MQRTTIIFMFMDPTHTHGVAPKDATAGPGRQRVCLAIASRRPPQPQNGHSGHRPRAAAHFQTACKKLASFKSSVFLRFPAPRERCSAPAPEDSQAPVQQYSKRQHASAAAATLRTVAIGHPPAVRARAAWWAHYLRVVAITPACCAYRIREIHRHTYLWCMYVWLCVEYTL